MNFRRRPAVALAAGLVLMLSACGFSDSKTSAPPGDGTATGQPVTIELLVPSYSDHTKELWNDVIKGFTAKHQDIKVSLQVESWENINDVVRTRIQSGKAPDILNIDSFTSYASDDLLYKAEEVVSPETLADFPESFRKNASTNGAQYGLPLIASARALFYNKDLFAKAGITAPPKTWDELADAAAKIKATGDIGYGMPLGNEEAQAETAVWFYGGGGGYGDGEKITIDTPANVAAGAFMKKLLDEGLTQPNAGSTQRTPLGDIFFQGKIGMVVGLPPYINMIKEKNPSLNYAVAPIPTKDGSPFTLGVADHLMAFKNDNSKQAAIKAFLDYFYSPEVYSVWVDKEGFIPTTNSGGEKLKDKELLAPFIPLMANAKFYPFTNPKWQGAQGEIQQKIGLLAQGEDPAKLLQGIQSKVDAS